MAKKYVYSVKTSGAGFEVKASNNTDALCIAKVWANALKLFVLGVQRKERA